MANKVIHLTYLWTDESVMQFDMQKKISEQMTDWATSFYTQFQFDVDVEPDAKARQKVATAAKYALQKNNGVRPDFRSGSEIADSLGIDLNRLFQEIQDHSKKKEDAELREQRLLARLPALSEGIKISLNVVNNATSAAARQAALDRATSLAAEVDIVLKQRDEAREEARRETDEILKRAPLLTKATSALGKAEAYEDELRLHMRHKFDADHVGSHKRLNIIFCRVAAQMSMRRSKWRVQARTLPANRPLLRFIPESLLVWPYPYTVIDIDAASSSTVAHEIVHAAGHDHPDPRTIIRYEKQILGFKRSSPGVIGGALKQSPLFGLEERYVPQYEIVPGGVFDGAKNDIMNYEVDESDPKKVILNDEDNKKMQNAFFVT